MKRFSKEEKLMWLADWQASGQGVWAYAKANGLNGQTFKNWTMLNEEKKDELVEVPAQLIRRVDRPQELTIEKGEIKIRIPLELDRNELRTVKELLGQAL